MKDCFFVTDIHGRQDRYQKLFQKIVAEKPEAVFMGGDLLPPDMKQILKDPSAVVVDFVNTYLKKNFLEIREKLKAEFPKVFLILGNDDVRREESEFIDAMESNIWEYVHQKTVRFGEFQVFGYSNVPPTPFAMKDWEKYDIEKKIPPGCTDWSKGLRSVIQTAAESETTIRQDLEQLIDPANMNQSILMFHSPPYNTHLDRAGLDGKMVDGKPLDLHCGSIAVRESIEKHQPLMTLHGHIHESPRLTGMWQDRIGGTPCLSAAHDGAELSLVRFRPEEPNAARRELI